MSNIKLANESSIKMLDLYFSELTFKNKRRTNEPANMQCENKVEYVYDPADSTKVTVLLDTTLKSNNDTIDIIVKTVGVFSIPLEIEEGERKFIEKNNTLAIMFPYVRSAITLLTAQPGLMPIVLPPINIAKLSKN